MYVNGSEFLKGKHEECQELTIYLISDRIGWGANKKNMYLSISVWNKLSQGSVDSQALQVSSYLYLYILEIYL